MTSDEIINEIERKLNETNVGIELWLDAGCWKIQSGMGMTFKEFLIQIVENA